VLCLTFRRNPQILIEKTALRMHYKAKLRWNEAPIEQKEEGARKHSHA